MTPKQFQAKLNKMTAEIESLEYDFFDKNNEDAALEVMVLMIHGLGELQNIMERDEAFRSFKKND
jgi:hypothetical protein